MDLNSRLEPPSLPSSASSAGLRWQHTRVSEFQSAWDLGGKTPWSFSGANTGLWLADWSQHRRAVTLSLAEKVNFDLPRGSLKISLDISYFFLVFFCQHNNHHFMPKPHQLSCGLTLSAWFNTVHWSLHCTALVTLSLLLPVTNTATTL